MNTKELSKEEYLGTMGVKMVDVTQTATPSADIWPYVQELTEKKLVLEYVTENELVELVYRNPSTGYDHVLLPTAKKDAFVVIIVNLNSSTIDGHYFLDLRAEYE
jgi:hypothetical protein